jgi:hypothetical protein
MMDLAIAGGGPNFVRGYSLTGRSFRDLNP